MPYCRPLPVAVSVTHRNNSSSELRVYASDGRLNLLVRTSPFTASSMPSWTSGISIHSSYVSTLGMVATTSLLIRTLPQTER